METKGIIFDMDGVLVDNRDVHIEVFIIFCSRYGVEPKREVMLSMFGKGNDEIMPQLLPAEVIDEKGIGALADEKEAIYREIFADRIAPVPGLVDFLKDIRTNGILTAVGSSGQAANVEFVLDRLGIAGCFDSVVNGDMVTRCKPDPEIFLLAAEKLGLSPSECIVIEDAFAGIEAANRAGMKVIALATTYPADALASTRNEMVVPDLTSLSYATVRNLE